MAQTGASDSTLVALADLQDGMAEMREMLVHLEARPIPDLAGTERRLDEFADAMDRMYTLLVRPRRPWWHVPAILTLAILLGFAVGWASVPWVRQIVVPPTVTQPAPPVIPSTPHSASPRKGK